MMRKKEEERMPIAAKRRKVPLRRIENNKDGEDTSQLLKRFGC